MRFGIRALAAATVALLLLASGCGSDDPPDTAVADETIEPAETDEASTASEPAEADDSEGSSSDESVLFVDDLGREVVVPASPERVVFANGELAGMVTTLGYAPLALHDSYSSDPEFIESLGGLTPDLAGTTFMDSAELNLEALKALEPDLLIWTNWLEPDQYDVISEEIAPIVALDPRTNGTNAYAAGEDEGETYSKQRKVAELVGVAGALDEQIDQYETQVEDVRTRHGEIVDELEFTLIDIYGDGLAWMYGNPVLAYGQVLSDLGIEMSTTMRDEVEGPDAEYYLQTSVSAETLTDFAADLLIVLMEDPSQPIDEVDGGVDAILAATEAGAAGQILVGDNVGWTLHSLQANVFVLEEIDRFLTENEVSNIGDF